MSEAWTIVDAYHMKRGLYSIAKLYSNGIAKYHLYRGQELLGQFDTVGQAQEIADELGEAC